MEHNGELRLALRRIAEIRTQLEEAGDINKLVTLCDAVTISKDANDAALNRLLMNQEERMMLDE